MKELEPVEARRVALTRELFPGVAMVQVYRQLFAHEEPVRRLEFTWSPATRSTRAIDPTVAIGKLEMSLSGSVPAEFKNHSSWHSVVEKEIRDIKSIGKGRLVIKKPVAPHPKVIVYFSEQETSTKSRHDKIHPASLPLFVHAPDGLSVAPLKMFLNDRKRKPRRAVKPVRWISEPLGIGVVG